MFELFFSNLSFSNLFFDKFIYMLESSEAHAKKFIKIEAKKCFFSDFEDFEI